MATFLKRHDGRTMQVADTDVAAAIAAGAKRASHADVTAWNAAVTGGTATTTLYGHPHSVVKTVLAEKQVQL